MATVRWTAWEGCETGLEHLEIRAVGGGILAEGLVVGATDGERFGLHYRILLDDAWQVREAALRIAAGATLQLTHDGEGGWTMDGRAEPLLSGCIDIDIEATPFTNTLPIRRLPWTVGGSEILTLAYVHVPSLAVTRARQRYSALPGSRFRFEASDTGFTAEIPVDSEGLVLDYPGLFRRLP